MGFCHNVYYCHLAIYLISYAGIINADKYQQLCNHLLLVSLNFRVIFQLQQLPCIPACIRGKSIYWAKKCLLGDKVSLEILTGYNVHPIIS